MATFKATRELRLKASFHRRSARGISEQVAEATANYRTDAHVRMVSRSGLHGDTGEQRRDELRGRPAQRSVSSVQRVSGNQSGRPPINVRFWEQGPPLWFR